MGLYDKPKSRSDKFIEMIARSLFGLLIATFVFFIQLRYIPNVSADVLADPSSDIGLASVAHILISSPEAFVLPLIVGVIAALHPGKLMRFLGRETY